MVISFRTTEEEGQRIKAFAASKDIKVSDLAREALDLYITEAEAERRRAEEEKQRQEQIARSLEMLEKYSGFLADTPLATMSDEEIRDMWRYRDA